MTLNDELKEKLTALAFDVTDNFCYGRYKVVEGDYCPGCHSDDFMRHLALVKGRSDRGDIELIPLNYKSLHSMTSQ